MSDSPEFFSSVESLAKFPEENPNPVLRADREGKMLYGNSAAKFLMDGLEFTVGENLPGPLFNAVAEAYATGKVAACELACGDRYYAVSCAPVEGADYCNLYGRDNTEHRLSEARIRDLARLADENPNPVIRISADFRILFYNEPFELIAKGWELGLGDRVPRVLVEAVDVAMSCNTTTQVEFAYGDHLYAFELTPFADGGYCNGYGSDITTRRQAEVSLIRVRDDALKASRSKSAFLANMSHEIRTPMNAVIGMNELMLNTELTEKQAQYAETIADSAKSLLSIINDILDFSKIEADKMKLRIFDFKIRDLIDELSRVLATSAQKKGLELLYRVEPGLPSFLKGDQDRLRQILVNLTNNAIKFTDKGEVNIGVTRADSGRVRFEVTDTGIGIPARAQRTLFAAFTQVDETHTRRHGGTGLGLTISQKLVDMMGGELAVTSEEGKGSSFFFEIDLPAGEEEDTDVYTDLTEHRILTVDDNATNRQILQEHLASWHVPQDSASSGAEALEKLREAATHGQAFDIMVLDGHMPVMDGMQVAEIVQSHPEEYGAPKIVMLTSFDGNLAEGDLQVARWLVKPVGQSRLYDCLLEVAKGKGRGKKKRAQSSPLNGEGRKVLLVDDNEVNQLVATEMLGELGFTPDVVENGQLALDAIKETRYDLVFMDCQMPVMDGYEATKNVRELEGAGRHTIIVALTAHAMGGDREKALAAGMDDYVVKPVSIAALRNTLEKWLRDPNDALDEVEGERPEVSAPLADQNRSPRVVGLFLKLGPRQLQDILTAKDAEGIRVTAHTLKGSALSLGIPGLATLCGEVEVLGKDGNFEEARDKLSDLGRSFEVARRALSEVAE